MAATVTWIHTAARLRHRGRQDRRPGRRPRSRRTARPSRAPGSVSDIEIGTALESL